MQNPLTPISPERRARLSQLPPHPTPQEPCALQGAWPLPTLIDLCSSSICNFQPPLLALQEGGSGVAKIAFPDAPLLGFGAKSECSMRSPHPQEPVLFGTTIMENIRFGKMGASDEEVYAAAREANAHEFITSFPEGYNTVVGESQGQRPAQVCRAQVVRSPGGKSRGMASGKTIPVAWAGRPGSVV